MKKNMETTIVCSGNLGIGRENGKTTVYWGDIWHNGKENGNYYSILGLDWAWLLQFLVLSALFVGFRPTVGFRCVPKP